jgi:hypothetical protein
VATLQPRGLPEWLLSSSVLWLGKPWAATNTPNATIATLALKTRRMSASLLCVNLATFVDANPWRGAEAALHRTDAMFQWRDRAYDARDVHLVFAPVDPKWDPYRGDRRFQEVMSRCGFTR